MADSATINIYGVTLEVLKPHVYVNPDGGQKTARYEIKVRANAPRTVDVKSHKGWEKDDGPDTLLFNENYAPFAMPAGGNAHWFQDRAYGKLDGPKDDWVELYHGVTFTVKGPDGIPSGDISLASPTLSAQVD